MPRLLGLPVLAATMLLLGLPPADASQGPDDGEDAGRLVLVLDASGSMADRTSGGAKIDAAKQALGEVVDSLPADAEVGMRVFGATVFSKDQPGACTDTQNVVPVGPVDREALRAAVAEYEPYGETPIGAALEGAAEDLGTQPGARTVVLVSDGEPTCRPDPCEVARKLQRRDIDVRIDVVGLSVSGAARRALQCVAAAGGGTYYDAADAGDLTDSMTRFADRAFRPFGFSGEPVRGIPHAEEAPVPEDLPVLTSGLWQDRLPRRDRPLLYRVARTEPGSTLHVGSTSPAEQGLTASAVRGTLSYLDDDGELSQCASESGFVAIEGARTPLVSSSVSSWTTDTESPCLTADELYYELSLGAGELTGRPVELAVYEEPALADLAGWREPVPELPSWRRMRPRRPRPGPVPGATISDAPVLGDGSYSLDINSGETQVFAVPLDWGQHLQAQVDLPISDRMAEATGVGSRIEARILGPLRDVSDGLGFGGEPADWSTEVFGNLEYSDLRSWRTGALSPTVAFANREATDPEVRGTALAGLRFISVQFSVMEPMTVPYTLTVRRFGEPGSVAPAYHASASLPMPTADAALAGALAVAGEAADEPEPTGEPSPEAGPEDAPPVAAGGPEATTWLVLGGGVVLALVVVGLVRRRLRRPTE